MSGMLRETRPDAPTEELLARLDSDGYLFFRGVLPPAAVLEVRRAILQALDDVGWIEGDPQDARPSVRARREEAAADEEFFGGYRAVQRLERFHALAHTPELVTLMARLVGDDVLVHPRKIARIGLPRDEYVVAAHQDHPLIQGTVDVLTAWIPVGDCPDELGGLKVLTGSHRPGLRPVAPVPNVGGLQIAEDLAGEDGWCTTDFRAGDVLVFHSLTVHAAKRNHTDRLRLSVDFRYQSAGEPVVEGSLLPHYFPLVPGHDELTAGWSSTAPVSLPRAPTIVEAFDPFSGPATPIRPRLVAVGNG